MEKLSYELVNVGVVIRVYWQVSHLCVSLYIATILTTLSGRLNAVVVAQGRGVLLQHICMHLTNLVREAAEARSNCVVLDELDLVRWLVYHVV